MINGVLPQLALELFNARKFIARLALFRRWLVVEIHHHLFAVLDVAPDFLLRARLRDARGRTEPRIEDAHHDVALIHHLLVEQRLRTATGGGMTVCAPIRE